VQTLNQDHLNTIAIDFGTARTKAAYYNVNTERIDLIQLGRKAPYIPSLFHLSRVGDKDRIVLGEDAENLGQRQPQGLVIGLKVEIHRQDRIRKGKLENRPTRKELLVRLFQFIHSATERTQQFRNQRPENCSITVPVVFEEIRREAIRDAALMAGFKNVVLIEEPVAAATAWTRGLDRKTDAPPGVIVCDVGGGTTDFALLRRTDIGYQVDERVPPDGHERMGGNYLDERIIEGLKETHPEFIQKMPIEELQQSICLQREMLHLGENSFVFQLPDQTVEIELELIREVTEEFNQDIQTVFSKFLSRCDANGVGDDIPVVLIGGGSRIEGLSICLQNVSKRKVYEWEESDVAVVKGAVLMPIQIKKNDGAWLPEKTVKHPPQSENSQNSPVTSLLIPTKGPPTPADDELMAELESPSVPLKSQTTPSLLSLVDDDSNFTTLEKREMEMLKWIEIKNLIALNDSSLFVSPNFDKGKLKKAMESYGPKIKESPIVFHDDTVFGGAKDGIIITGNGVYWKNASDTPKYLPFENIQSVTFSRSIFNPRVKINEINIEVQSASGNLSSLAKLLIEFIKRASKEFG